MTVNEYLREKHVDIRISYLKRDELPEEVRPKKKSTDDEQVQ
jgi:hypothetical protein